jgi:hypothetical protein
VENKGFLLEFLSAVYERLLELARASDERTLTQTFAAATDTKVFHGLGRPVVEWEVIDRNANAVLWQSTAANERPNLYIIIQASAAVTAKLRFA